MICIRRPSSAAPAIAVSLFLAGSGTAHAQDLPGPPGYADGYDYPRSGGLYDDGYSDDDWFNDYYEPRDLRTNDYQRNLYGSYPLRANEFTEVGPYTYPYAGGLYDDGYYDDDWFNDYYGYEGVNYDRLEEFDPYFQYDDLTGRGEPFDRIEEYYDRISDTHLEVGR